MAKRPTVSSISRARAEADFATWSMMAKLGSLPDLSPEAQQYLAAYQERLKTMAEPAAVAATIDDIDAAYQQRMKRAGPAGQQQIDVSFETADIVGIKEGERIRAAREAAARKPASTQKRPLPAWLIFAGLVAAVVGYRYLSGGFGQ